MNNVLLAIIALLLLVGILLVRQWLKKINEDTNEWLMTIHKDNLEWLQEIAHHLSSKN